MMHQDDLAIAREAVARAGEYLRDAYAKFEPIPNAPANISTEADRTSQEIILTFLRQRCPADRLCAEEATPTLRCAPATGPRVWIVDPIDGTRGFARKNGEFSVMVGLVEQGTIVVGVVGQPAVGRVTYATRGGGCWRCDNEADPVRCQTTLHATLTAATLTKSRSRAGARPDVWVERLKPGRVVESYSAGIKLALVARGEADIYVNSYEAFRDWDICAGHILVTEAGGTVTGLKGESLEYGLPGAWQRQGLLATNGMLHSAVTKSQNC